MRDKYSIPPPLSPFVRLAASRLGRAENSKSFSLKSLPPCIRLRQPSKARETTRVFAMRDADFRQPCHALVPHAFTLEAAEQWALRKASCLAVDRFRLTSFWHVDYFRQHVPGEIKRRYTMRLAQAEDYGVAFGDPPPLRDTDRALVGEDSRETSRLDSIRMTSLGRP